MANDKVRDSPEGELQDNGGKLRLYVDAPLAPDMEIVATPAQAHYLVNVMRAHDGDRLRLFNGRDGEWAARIADATKRSVGLVCVAEIRPQTEVPDLWLAFAPIKKTPADYVAQKATELGVRVLQPVITMRTVVRRVNEERLHANAVEAAEQSGRVSVPEVRAPVSLDALLADWPSDRRLVFCDEAGEGAPIADALSSERGGSGSWGILVGPEGGFDASERTAIRSRPYVVAVTLGPRIVRADTAALAALSVWQAVLGDWH